jgi:hypothetical protein
MEIHANSAMRATAFRQALRAAAASKNWKVVDELQRILGQVNASENGDHLLARMSSQAQRFVSEK